MESCSTLPKLAPLLFLLGAAFSCVALAVFAELETGEQSLRGLIHAGILFFFAILLLHGRSTLSLPFATFSILIALGGGGRGLFAPLVDSSAVLLLLSLLACGAMSRQPFPASSLAAVAAGVATLSSTVDLQEAVAEIFHRSFVAALGVAETHEGTRNLFGFACLLLASFALLHGLLEGGVLYAAAAGWGALSAGHRGAASSSAPLLEADIARGPAWRGTLLYNVASLAYALVLFLEAHALSKKGEEDLVSFTRYIHAAALLGALWGLVPNALGAWPVLKWPLLSFPCLDVALSVYRSRTDETSDLLRLVRAGGALMVALSLLIPPVRWCDRSEVEEGGRRRLLGPIVLAAYMAAHSYYGCTLSTYEETVHVVFHTIVIGGGLAGSALLTRDASVWSTAAGFLCLEALGGSVLAVEGGEWLFFLMAGTEWLLLGTVLSVRDALLGAASGDSLFALSRPDGPPF